MRTTIAKQADLFAPAVDHKLSKELGQIHEVLIAHPEWIRWVHRDLTRALGVSARRVGPVCRPAWSSESPC